MRDLFQSGFDLKGNFAGHPSVDVAFSIQIIIERLREFEWRFFAIKATEKRCTHRPNIGLRE